ncbi:MAG: hypothetical protein AAF960_30415 [Bacteroidota bacterium]
MEKLLELKKKEYFSLEEWEIRGLQISNDAVIQKMRLLTENYLDGLLGLVNKSGKLSNSNINKLISALEDKFFPHLDTEEREWCSDIFTEILEEIGFDQLNIIELINQRYNDS